MDIAQPSASPNRDLWLLKEFLDCHGCPTVIIDCEPSTSTTTTAPAIVYSNPSYALWMQRSSCPEGSFIQWAENLPSWNAIEPGNTTNIPYAGMNWVVYLVGRRWTMLQSQSPFNDLLALDKDRLNRPRKRLQLISNEHSPLMISPTLTPVQEAQSCVTDPLLAHAPPSAEPPGLLADWTRYDIPNPSEWIKFLRNYDWAKTTIGPMQDWSLIVRQNVFFLMSNSMPAAVYFGQEEPTMLYNEACSKLLGKLHPEAMGVSGKVGAGSAWARKWAGIKKVLATACTFREYDLYHPVPRGDLKWEEAYFSWCTLPLIDQNGRIFGVMKEFEETSTRVIEKRRVRIVHSAENMQPSENIDAFWTQVRNIIEDDPEDFPFCLLYSAPPRPDSMKFGMSSLGESVPSPFRLEGLVGLKDDHDLAIKFLDPSKPGYPLAKDFQTAWVSGKCVLLRTFNGTLPKNLEPSIEGRGFGEQCHTAVLYPINRMDGPGVVGFLLIGLNPQRNFDEAFRGFLRSVTDQFTKAAAAILVPEERKVLLQQKLKDEEREHIFTQLAKRAPVGWVLMEPSGDIRDKNSEFMSLSNIHEDERACFGFKIPFYPGDELIAQRQFAQSVSSIKPVCFQFRVQADLGKPADPNDPRHWRCLLANASSEADSDGNCLWVATFLTDITAEKEIQGKTLGDALEMKRKSENFIDMTCHEMRNPLSAIIQSADGVLTAFDSLGPGEEKYALSDPGPQPIPGSVREAVLDSAQTIMLCAQHQKRIVDDILTISKSESCRLQICPDQVEPIALVEKALQMYEAELASAAITAGFVVDPSYHELVVGHVLVDRARLLQIIINLLTNAIKFTKTEPRRKITITLRASVSAPTVSDRMSFIYRRQTRDDSLSSPEWGQGEVLYLQFDVRDTGKGMTQQETKRLFQRFSQASFQTYSQYGGSGLGLFISRELTELHGGQIGVSSLWGKGSTFAFYIKTRRCETKPSAKEELTKTSASGSDASSSCAPSSSCCNPKDLHILLVEDNLINQRVTALQLRKVGCTVHVANDGQECLDFLEKTSFYRPATGRANDIPIDEQDAPNSKVDAKKTEEDLQDTNSDPSPLPLSVILLDQEMPVMDGLTCVRKIREWQQSGQLNGHVPVLACTGNARREQIATSLEAGMDEVVTKPFRIPDLLPKIFALIDRLKTCPIGEAAGKAEYADML